MKPVFKVGDTVYHAAHGGGKIEALNQPNHNRLNGRTILVRFWESPIEGAVIRQYGEKELSFKPWPAPCHERPLQDGWYVRKTVHDTYIPQLYRDGLWHVLDAVTGVPTVSVFQKNTGPVKQLSTL